MHSITLKGKITKGLPDIESIQIGIQFNAIMRDKKAKRKIILPCLGIKVNLYSLVIASRDNETKLLTRAEDNDRESR